MLKKISKKYWLLPFVILSSEICFAQFRITSPWSASLNVTFGQGTVNPGPPLNTGSSDFTYTSNSCPDPGFYTVVNKQTCAILNMPPRDDGLFFNGDILMAGDSGYMMLVTQSASPAAKIIFEDTIKNLCRNNAYLFWAAIKDAGGDHCFYPSLTFSAETTAGTVIQSFPTGNIGGSGDKATFYPGYYDLIFGPPPPFPFYGGSFTLPAGITDIVVKIIANPSAANPRCTYTLAIDNILLTPVASNVNIKSIVNPNGWIVGACFEGNVPVLLNSDLDTSYLNFGPPSYTTKKYIDPLYQWQLSDDGGFTWQDIAGEINSSLSHVFSIPDTFFIRLRTAEAGDFSNLNCNIVSNIIKVEVDGLPSGYSVSSNSPVCTDGDLAFEFNGGGATFSITGPNGFNDNSAKPHIYNPPLADSGWYYAEMSTFGGCKVRDSVYVKVIGPNVTVSADTSVCYGKTVQLKATGGDVYSWSPAAGLSDANVFNPWASPLGTTKYEVYVKDQSGCGAQAFVTVMLRDSILKAGIAGTAVVCPKDVAQFTDSSQGKIKDWFWDFGNGETNKNKIVPPQIYKSNNIVNYQVQLIITDSAGCADTAYHLIKAVNNCYIVVPNAFSPNGDGSNDYLYPLNAWKAKNLSFNVYNRYGQLIFQTREWTNKWDGTINGTPQPAGVYVWMLRYTDGDTGQEVFEKGTVVLIR